MQERSSQPQRSDVIARHAIVTGFVQGVGFRYYTKIEAHELGLAGFVRNRDDGSVEVSVEGPKDAVERFLHWLERGPPSARVERVSVREAEPSHARRFEVRRD